MLLRVAATLTACALSAPALAQDEPTPTSPYDFAISRQFLEDFLAQRTFLPTFKIKMHSRSNVHRLANDCEIHLGGDVVGGATFGDPPAVVVEPPNLCKFLPGATTPTTSSTGATWRTRVDTKVLNKDCDVTGFPRIYTEHATGGSDTGSSNPNQRLRDSPGDADCVSRRHATGLHQVPPFVPDTAAHQARIGALVHHWPSGVGAVPQHGRGGPVRVFENRPGGCGNFAIVEVGSLPREWIQKTNGGHTGARATAL